MITPELYDMVLANLDLLRQMGKISDYDYEQRLHKLNKDYVTGLHKANTQKVRLQNEQDNV